MDATSHSTIVNPVTVSHDRTRPLSNNSGHCLETHTESHLEVDETDSPDNSTVISHLTTANSSTVFHDSTRLPSKNPGLCLETDARSQLEYADTATSSTMVKTTNVMVLLNLNNMVRIQILRILLVSLNRTGKYICIVIK
jgi:hypothetical protein